MFIQKLNLILKCVDILEIELTSELAEWLPMARTDCSSYVRVGGFPGSLLSVVLFSVASGCV